MPADVDDLADIREATARVLRAWHALVPDDRLSRAAAVLEGGRAGRRPVDDEAALRLMRSILDHGLATSINAAGLATARMLAPPHQVEAMRKRLARKFGRK